MGIICPFVFSQTSSWHNSARLSTILAHRAKLHAAFLELGPKNVLRHSKFTILKELVPETVTRVCLAAGVAYLLNHALHCFLPLLALCKRKWPSTLGGQSGFRTTDCLVNFLKALRFYCVISSLGWFTSDLQVMIFFLCFFVLSALVLEFWHGFNGVQSF